MHAGDGTGCHWTVPQPPLDGAAAPTRRSRSPHSSGADDQRGLLLELRVLVVPLGDGAGSPGQPKTGPLVLQSRDAVVEPRSTDLAPPERWVRHLGRASDQRAHRAG